MSRWQTQFSVSETDALAHRLEANAEPALDLNSDMLDWLCNATGSNLGDVLSRFPSGLVFDVEGVEAMVQELFPGARWAVGTICENRILHGARILLRGHQTPFAGMADTSACALLAALLRAYAATAAPDVARRAA